MPGALMSEGVWLDGKSSYHGIYDLMSDEDERAFGQGLDQAKLYQD